MKRQVLKSALIFQPSLDNSFLRVDLASTKQTFQKIISFKNSYYILTEQGDIWQVENNPTSESTPSNLHLAFLPFPELTKCKIADIVANGTVMFIITRNHSKILGLLIYLGHGFVYSWGEDPNNYGLLGLKDIQSTEKPEKIPELSRYVFEMSKRGLKGNRITYISVSTKHAAAIDDKGNLFTWGTGSKGELCHTGVQKVNSPLMFQSALLLSSKIVVCYQELTGVITTGGHLCLYGEFSKDPSDQTDLVNSNIPKTINNEFTPKSILGIPKMSFITSLSFSDNFAVFLTKKYEIFIITNHYICQKLDFSTKFKTITVKRNSIFGLTEDGRYMVEWEYLKSVESQRGDQAAVTFLAGSDTKVLQVTQLYDTYCKNSAYQQFQEAYNVTMTYESKAPQTAKEKFDPFNKEKEMKVKLEYLNVIGKKATIKCLNYKNPPYPLTESLVSSPTSHRPRNCPLSPGSNIPSSYRSSTNILSLNHFAEENKDGGGYSYKSNVSTPKKLESFLLESKKSPKSAFHSPARSLVLKSGVNSRQPSYTDLRCLSLQALNVDFTVVAADLKSQVEKSSPQKNINASPIKSPSNIASIAATPKAGHSITPAEFSSMASVDVVVSPSNKKQELVGLLNSLKKANENNNNKEQRLQNLKENFFLSKNNPRLMTEQMVPITTPKNRIETEPEPEKADFKTRLSKAMEVCKNLSVGNTSKVSSPTHTFKTSEETVYFTAAGTFRTEENKTDDKKSSIRERLENLKKARRQKESISEVENLLIDTQTVEQQNPEEEHEEEGDHLAVLENENHTPIFPVATSTLIQSQPSPKLEDLQNFSFKNKAPSYLQDAQQESQPPQHPEDFNHVNIKLDSPNGKNLHEPTPKFSPTRVTFLNGSDKSSPTSKAKKPSVVESLLAALSDSDNKFTLHSSSFRQQKKKNKLKDLAELQVTQESQPKSPREEEPPLNIHKRLSTRFETIETQINEATAVDIQANEKKVGTFLSGIGSQDEVKVESVQHLGEIVHLCSLTDPECLKQAEETEKPKQSFQNIDSKKWEVLFTGTESPQGRSLAGSKKSTGKFGGLRAYEELLMKATSLGDHVENSSSKNENNQSILREKSIIWMASTLMKKLDHQMYKSFLAIQLHGLKTDNEQVYKLYRFLAIIKSFEREYNHYNKACSFDVIRQVPSKSLNQMISKSAFRKLNGVISIWSVIEKNIINTERRVLRLLQKDQDSSSLHQYKLLEILVLRLEQNKIAHQESIKREAFEKIVSYVKAKREKYANSALNLAQALDNYQTKALLIPAFGRVQEYLEKKTTMYINLVSEKGLSVNSHLENFLQKYRQKIFQQIYTYSRTCPRKRPKSIQLGFAVILKSLYQRRLKNYFNTLCHHNSQAQKVNDKSPMQNVILKFLVNMLQRKLTRNMRDAFAALNTKEELKATEEADNLKEMNYKLLLLFSALNNIIKQKKSLAFNTLRWYLNLKIRTKNQQLAAICFKNLQERVVKRSLNAAFACLVENQNEQENLSLQEEEEDPEILVENGLLDRVNSSGTDLASSPHFRLPTDQHSDNILNLKEFEDNSPPSDIGQGLSKVIDTSMFSKKSFNLNDKDFRLGARGNKNIYKTSVEDLTNINNFETPKEYCWNSFPNACQKEEENQKLQDVLTKIEKSRKYYRSLSEALCDKVYRTATQPESEALQLKPTRSLKFLRLDSQQSNPSSQDKVLPEREKSMRIFERLKKIAIMKQNKRLNIVSDSAEIASCQSDSVDLAKIREILNKRKAQSKKVNGPYKRDKNSSPDIQILLHGKGPHNNRPDQVMQLFNYKVPRKDTLDSSVASIDQSSNKLNISEVYSNKNSRSLIIPSIDSLDRTGSKKSSKQLKKSATVYKKADDSMSQTSFNDEEGSVHERLPTFSNIPEGSKKYPTPSKTLKSQFSLPIYRNNPVKPHEKRHSGIPQASNLSNFRDTPEPAILEEEKVTEKDNSICYLVRNDSYWSAANSNNEKAVDLKSQKSIDSNNNTFSDISSPITPLPKKEESEVTEIKKAEEPPQELKKDDSLIHLKKVPAKKQPTAPVREMKVTNKITSSTTSNTSKTSTTAAPARKNSKILVNGQAISPIHKPTTTKPKATTKK